MIATRDEPAGRVGYMRVVHMRPAGPDDADPLAQLETRTRLTLRPGEAMLLVPSVESDGCWPLPYATDERDATDDERRRSVRRVTDEGEGS